MLLFHSFLYISLSIDNSEPLKKAKAERPQLSKLFAPLMINPQYIFNPYPFSVLFGSSAAKNIFVRCYALSPNFK